MIKQIGYDLKELMKHKIFTISLILIAVLSYGFMIVNPSIGIDDTATSLYFTEGQAVVMGRWTLFLLNRIVPFAEFTPFIFELLGVALLCMGACLFCVVLYRIFRDEVSMLAYTLMVCLFISNSIISEDFIYYLHNGVGLGYFLSGLALLIFQSTYAEKGLRKCCKNYIISMVLLWIAVGCYESFVVVFMIGVFITLIAMLYKGDVTLKSRDIVRIIFMCGMVVLGCIILRSIAINGITALFRIDVNYMGERTLSEGLQILQADNVVAEFAMLVKRFWVLYYVNAIVYLPSLGNVLAVSILFTLTITLLFWKKKVWPLLLSLAVIVTPFLLTIIEAKTTYYRSCQHMPMFTAMVFFLLYAVISEYKSRRFIRYVTYIYGVFLIIFIWNQAADMNKWFYIDYTKYQNTKEVLNEVAYEIEKNCDTTKPVIFTGHYDTPHELIKDAYVSYGSKQFQWIARITDLVDVHLKEKYYSSYGYSFVGEGIYPFIQWGLDAFDGTNREMIAFLEAHGHSLYTTSDLTLIEEANVLGESMPEWPASGSVVEKEEYIIVHF